MKLKNLILTSIFFLMSCVPNLRIFQNHKEKEIIMNKHEEVEEFISFLELCKEIKKDGGIAELVENYEDNIEKGKKEIAHLISLNGNVYSCVPKEKIESIVNKKNFLKAEKIAEERIFRGFYGWYGKLFIDPGINLYIPDYIVTAPKKKTLEIKIDKLDRDIRKKLESFSNQEDEKIGEKLGYDKELTKRYLNKIRGIIKSGIKNKKLDIIFFYEGINEINIEYSNYYEEMGKKINKISLGEKPKFKFMIIYMH